MTATTWLLYGANGYTGELLARLAAERGERPVLAGRNGPAVRRLAEELGLEHRVISLADRARVDAALADIDVVMHCAGPFSATSAPMVDACLRTGVHYADLTGEIAVFEAVYGRHTEARAAGVALVPGVGFDVVPTDHLLVRLQDELPDAVAADVALVSRGGFSAGTLRTVVEGMRAGGQVRRDGELVGVPTGHRSRRLRYGTTDVRVTSVPLGDVASGYRATGIPTITNFTNVPAGRLVAAFDGVTRRALRIDPLHRSVDRTIARLDGPSPERRARTRSDLWAELRTADGRSVAGAIQVPNTYDFTAHSALAAVRRLLRGDLRPGAWTPSQAFGADFLLTIPDIEVTTLPA